MTMTPEEKKKILQELGGIPEEVYDELVRDFIDTTRASIEELRSKISSADLPGVRAAAHSIKGSSANLRLYAISKAAQALEETSKAGQGANLSSLLSDLEKEFLQL